MATLFQERYAHGRPPQLGAQARVAVIAHAMR